MSSEARKMRRKMRRMMPHLSNENADAVRKSIDGLVEARRRQTEEVSAKVYQRLSVEMRERVTPEVMGDMFVLFLAWLRDKKGYGAKRLPEAAESLEDYISGIYEAKITRNDIISSIKDECGVDIAAVFEKILKEKGALSA